MKCSYKSFLVYKLIQIIFYSYYIDLVGFDFGALAGGIIQQAVKQAQPRPQQTQAQPNDKYLDRLIDWYIDRLIDW